MIWIEEDLNRVHFGPRHRLFHTRFRVVRELSPHDPRKPESISVN